MPKRNVLHEKEDSMSTQIRNQSKGKRKREEENEGFSDRLVKSSESFVSAFLGRHNRISLLFNHRKPAW